MLHLYNSLNNAKEVFAPIEPGRVRMYVCGITVYDFCHIGHARMMVVFDTVYRYLRSSGFDVMYVRNITDIDDNIIKRAQENGEDFRVLTQRYIASMHEDMDALGVLRPAHEPKATEHIPSIVHMIELLLQKGFAYRAENQDVYYSVKNFVGYGKLSGKKLEDLRAGARVEIGELKKDPLDFVLWKAAKPGEPAWSSPWGHGRPGWHIECSAMSTEILGQHFDIHGGGQDLQFPHHENEIAQSEACYGNHRFVNYWMHNGFVRVNEEKMSKSLGNFFTIRDVLKQYKGEEIRYFILNSHYRSQLNYSDEQLDAARTALSRLYTALRGVTSVTVENSFGAEYRQRFAAAMDDDFNTPEALAVLFELAHVINRCQDIASDEARAAAGLLRTLGGILGILQADPESYLQSGVNGMSGLSDVEIEGLIEQRKQARVAKNWVESDRIRDLLTQHGIVLEDSAKGTRWRRS